MWKKLQGWAILGALLLFVSFGYRWVTARFLVPPLRIDDAERGMEPLIIASETVWRLDRAIASAADLRHGDVVVFRYPGVWKENGLIPARVAGLPGDWVSFQNGKLFRNGKEIVEAWNPKRDAVYSAFPVLVPRNHVFLLMDDRVFRFGGVPQYHDSRSLKPMPFSLLLGRMTHFSKKGA